MPVVTACAVLGVPRSSLYRSRQPPAPPAPADTLPAPPARALSEPEKAQVHDLLNSERFQDQVPREVYATLLDAGEYYCSWRTMYCILAEHAEVRERRDQLRHPHYARPELLATGPNQLWSWDITKLRWPLKGVYYYLYVILDVFSRYVPGWLIAERESGELAQELIAETCRKQGIEVRQPTGGLRLLTIHADHGSAMMAKSVAQLLADLGIQKSHSRPHVANDNPYSEAQFGALKYCPAYPERFGSVAKARQWGQEFFTWYNNEHHHTSLALLTPADVHYGRAAAILAARQSVLQQAYAAHPERFVKGVPTVPQLPAAVWINPPKQDAEPMIAVEERSPASTEHAADVPREISC
jgi:putative transposase